MIYIYIKRTLERIARVFHPGCFPTKKNNSNSHPRLSSTEEKQMQAIQLSQFSCLEKKPMDPNSRYVCIVSIATKIGSPHLWDTEFYNNKKHIYIYTVPLNFKIPGASLTWFFSWKKKAGNFAGVWPHKPTWWTGACPWWSAMLGFASLKSRTKSGLKSRWTIYGWYMPAPPKRCQYDPKGWLMGTPYQSFSTP